jgi:hypothetical protein
MVYDFLMCRFEESGFVDGKNRAVIVSGRGSKGIKFQLYDVHVVGN